MLLQVGFDDNTYYFIVQFTDNIRMLLQVGFDDNTYYFIVQFTDNIRMLLQVGFDDNTYYFIVQFTDNICSYKWGLTITCVLMSENIWRSIT